MKTAAAPEREIPTALKPFCRTDPAIAAFMTMYLRGDCSLRGALIALAEHQARCLQYLRAELVKAHAERGQSLVLRWEGEPGGSGFSSG